MGQPAVTTEIQINTFGGCVQDAEVRGAGGFHATPLSVIMPGMERPMSVGEVEDRDLKEWANAERGC
jgi:hypothetical protein